MTDYSTPLAARLAGSAATTDYASNMTYRPERYPVGSPARVAYVNAWQDLSLTMRQAEDDHLEDCGYCAAGESSVHNYEPTV